jgi:WhiB family redox-sensing transcriptional regulator
MVARMNTEPANPTWRNSAACRGVAVSLFFPDKGENATQAKLVCKGCDVRRECLQDAISAEGQEAKPHGIFGGMGTRERYAYRRKYGTTVTVLPPVRIAFAGRPPKNNVVDLATRRAVA